MMMFIDLHELEGTFKIISIHHCFGLFVVSFLASTGSITVIEDGE